MRGISGHRRPPAELQVRIHALLDYAKSIFEEQTTRRAIREKMVTAAHGHSQPQRSHRCAPGLLLGNGISDR
ncbi:hypothetical protein EVAR_30956_1 [Eumeta japonica]|uniref:Uncharacterized protein n=1 Tax=Eumeta variegata TaxID=151549 RepID=A0A4C1W9W7_EUMVA|nr:hypothetical protein EVAR_30956_1 [Eumeta japonica]